jgi:hypothetical protein
VPRSRTLGAIPPLSQYVFMAWCSVKAQGQLRSHFQWLETIESIYSDVKQNMTFKELHSHFQIMQF